MPMLSPFGARHWPWYHGPHTMKFVSCGSCAVAFSLRRPPLAVVPRTGDHEVRVLRVVLLGVAEDLPRSPGIFLVPEARDVQVRHRRRVQLADPRLLLPEVVVVRMSDDVIPIRNRAVEVPGVDVRERTEGQVPRVSVVRFEREEIGRA